MMNFDCCIRNTCVLDDSGQVQPAVIGIQGEQIVALDVADAQTARWEIDAQARLAIPGLVDPHVHFNEPGRETWEGFETGSRAAIAGAITSICDMPLNSTPPVCDRAAFDAKAEAGAANAHVDFGIWGGLVPGNIHTLEALCEAGVVGFKAFMCDSGLEEFPAVDTDTLLNGMDVIARTGLRLAVHAEHPDYLGHTGPDASSFLASRPVEAEVAAIELALECAGSTGCPLHVVHVSSPEGLDAIELARGQGTDVTCETCPHYLLLTEHQLGTLGTVAKCAPPLRTEEHVSKLRQQLRDGKFDCITSDHSPCTGDMKSQDDFEKAWGGISGIQHGLPLLFAADVLPLHTLIQLMSAGPSRVFNFGSKGQLAPGMDADIILFDSDTSGSVTADDLLYRNPHTPYIGFDTRGVVKEVFLRGNHIFSQGHFLSSPGGRLLTPHTKKGTVTS
jgi:allantoinase